VVIVNIEGRGLLGIINVRLYGVVVVLLVMLKAIVLLY
jgi:hypothetical protein